jgi:hypothetical protein
MNKVIITTPDVKLEAGIMEALMGENEVVDTKKEETFDIAITVLKYLEDNSYLNNKLSFVLNEKGFYDYYLLTNFPDANSPLVYVGTISDKIVDLNKVDFAKYCMNLLKKISTLDKKNSVQSTKGIDYTSFLEYSEASLDYLETQFREVYFDKRAIGELYGYNLEDRFLYRYLKEIYPNIKQEYPYFFTSESIDCSVAPDDGLFGNIKFTVTITLSCQLTQTDSFISGYQHSIELPSWVGRDTQTVKSYLEEHMDKKWFTKMCEKEMDACERIKNDIVFFIDKSIHFFFTHFCKPFFVHMLF